MPDFGRTLEQLRAARAARAQARQRSYAAQVERLALQRQAERNRRSSDDRQGEVDGRLERAEAAVTDLAREEIGAARAVDDLLAGLHEDTSPETLIANWSADIPILLLPLRVETRWWTGELLVRVFPDEIAIDTHEEALTKSENAAGEVYWRAIAAARQNPNAPDTGRKEAWHKLVQAFGAPRAAYVVRHTKPTNWDATPSPDAAGLAFAPPGTLKEDRWTEAPRVHVLPDRLTLMLLRGGRTVRTATGNLIDDVVHAGPAPLMADGKASWARDAQGHIAFDAESLWLKDFDVAVAGGLGFRLALQPGDEQGFDELIVLGLNHSASTSETTRLVGDLFAGHRFSPKGLALVPQGTATNNTSDDDAGLDSTDWFADASYQAEMSAAAPDIGDLDAASDGKRLAAYLGLDPGLFAGVANADRHDHAEAVAMNTALYPGTLGYFLRSMIPEVASDEALADLRLFFSRSVTGRGPLAAFRVGNQPYGILLAGPAPRDRPDERPAHTAFFGPDIERVIERLIARARGYWMGFLPNLARLGASANASADLLAVMGLQPTAAEYFQRIATTYDHLANLAGFQTGGNRMDEVFKSVFDGIEAHAVATGLGYRQQRADGSQKPYPLLFQLIYQSYQTRVPSLSLIDGQPFSETDPIKPYDMAATRNYIDWLIANARSPEALRSQDFAGAARPSALLYMLLRHALLIQSAASVNLWLRQYAIEAPELIASRKFLNMSAKVDIAAWEMLSAPANTLKGAVASDQPLLAMVHLPEFRIGPNAAVGAPLSDMLAAYQMLRGLPTARLERLFAEHIDTLSYRIDAWETALFDRSLRRRRERAQGAPGLYLGSIGYLENLRPALGKRRRIEEAMLPPALRQVDGSPLFTQIGGAGFVHTPSLNHATAAAILRNGYLTHATPDDPNRLAVNLNSGRVRRAKELMDGVRNGQPLEVLLGIQFERALHEATTRPTAPVVLNDLKPSFRKAFPVQRTRVPRAGHAGEGPEIVPDYSVANGLAIAAAPETFPVGVAGLPALSLDKTAELKTIRDGLRDSLDALKDVVTAESAYQLSLGNFDRSAAIVQSLAGALAAPEIEVTQTSRGTDLTFTQRVAIQLDPARTANPWPAIAMTSRARVEGPLNAWLADMLGDPIRYACTVELQDAGPVTVTSVRLADLGLQPIDLVQVCRGLRDATGPVELESRIAVVALAATGLPAASKVSITFAAPGPAPVGTAPMADALHLLDLAHQVIAGARALDGRDSVSASKPSAAGTEPSGIDIAELRMRFAALLAEFDGIAAALATALAAAQGPGAGDPAFAALSVALRRAADAGVPFAFPATGHDSLIAQTGVIGGAIATMRKQATAQETASHAAGLAVTQQAERLIKAAQEFLGADFRILPRFRYANAPDVAASNTDRDAILAFARAGDVSVDPVGEVLTSVAQVRGAIHRLVRLRLMQDMMAANAPEVAALQLPHRLDDVWLGAALPVGREIFHDTLSLIQLRPQGFAPGGDQCGLLVDEWVESFPRKREVTGLAFGFDQPNSAPLQSLLLAVAPDEAAHWDWAALVDIVRQTVLRAKLRAVEPDMLDKVPGVTTLLPATMAEFSTSPGALSLDFGLAVPILLTQAIEFGYASKLTGTS
jgi:hypothetical protein